MAQTATFSNGASQNKPDGAINGSAAPTASGAVDAATSQAFIDRVCVSALIPVLARCG